VDADGTQGAQQAEVVHTHPKLNSLARQYSDAAFCHTVGLVDKELYRMIARYLEEA
jgi:hypothetical protein